MNKTLKTGNTSVSNGKKDQKVTDKSLSHIILTAGLSIFACLVMLFASTWAMFTDSTTTSSNKIVASYYEGVTAVSVTDGNYTEEVAGIYTFETGTYTLTLAQEEESTATTGFAVIKFGESRFYTVQIGKTTAEPNASITLYLTVTDVTAVLRISYVWGTLAVTPDIENGATLTCYGGALSILNPAP